MNTIVAYVIAGAVILRAAAGLFAHGLAGTGASALLVRSSGRVVRR